MIQRAWHRQGIADGPYSQGILSDPNLQRKPEGERKLGRPQCLVQHVRRTGGDRQNESK